MIMQRTGRKRPPLKISDEIERLRAKWFADIDYYNKGHLHMLILCLRMH